MARRTMADTVADCLPGEFRTVYYTLEVEGGKGVVSGQVFEINHSILVILRASDKEPVILYHHEVDGIY